MYKQLFMALAEKVENMLKIGKYTNVNGSDGNLQKIQIKTLRNIEDALKVGQFGINSKAPLKSRCVVARIGNENIVIANEHQASIIDIGSGNTIVYNENGDYIKIEKDVITIKSKKLIINSEDIELNGNTKIDGTLYVTKTIKSEDEITAISAGAGVTVSKHLHTGNLGQPTSAPTQGT